MGVRKALKIPKPIIIIVQAFFLALGRFSGLNSYENTELPKTEIDAVGIKIHRKH